MVSDARRVYRVTHLLKRVEGALEIVLCETACNSVGPLHLACRDRTERGVSARCELRELRSLMGGSVRVRHQAVGLEEVGRPLNALPRETHSPGDIGDRSPVLLERSQHLPSGARLADGTRQRISRSQKAAIHLKDFEDQPGKALARRRTLH